MTPTYTFETVYPRYTFAPLVGYAMALSRLIARTRRAHAGKAAYPDSATARPAH